MSMLDGEYGTADELASPDPSLTTAAGAVALLGIATFGAFEGGQHDSKQLQLSGMLKPPKLRCIGNCSRFYCRRRKAGV